MLNISLRLSETYFLRHVDPNKNEVEMNNLIKE